MFCRDGNRVAIGTGAEREVEARFLIHFHDNGRDGDAFGSPLPSLAVTV